MNEKRNYAKKNNIEKKTYPSMQPQSHGKSSRMCDNTAIEATSKDDGIKVNLITIPETFFNAPKSKPRPAKSIMLTIASSLQYINFYLKRNFGKQRFTFQDEGFTLHIHILEPKKKKSGSNRKRNAWEKTHTQNFRIGDDI